jgi:hypothetical protein
VHRRLHTQSKQQSTKQRRTQITLEIIKPNKADQAAYVAQAIEQARIGAPAYEGSANPTGSVVFYNRTAHEAFERWADLKAQGWELIYEIPVFAGKLFDFSARKPEEVFELDIPVITLRAEAAYKAGIEKHNAAVQRQLQDEAEIMAEFERRETARKVKLLEDIREERRGARHI